MPSRADVERRSAVLLLVLDRVPRWVLGLLAALLLGLVLLGPALPAAVALVLLVAALGWLSYLSWPASDGSTRRLRLLALALITALGIAAVVS